MALDPFWASSVQTRFLRLVLGFPKAFLECGKLIFSMFFCASHSLIGSLHFIIYLFHMFWVSCFFGVLVLVLEFVLFLHIHSFIHVLHHGDIDFLTCVYVSVVLLITLKKHSCLVIKWSCHSAVIQMITFLYYFTLMFSLYFLCCSTSFSDVNLVRRQVFLIIVVLFHYQVLSHTPICVF